jgi:succinate dehydrogenase / fumarate reductase flavoprotein subunit
MSEEEDVDTPVSPGALGVSDEDVAADGALVDPSEVIDHHVTAEEQRVTDLLEKDDGVNHAEVRADVQETMTENVNVFREEGNLKEALEDLRVARERYQDVYVRDPSRTFNTDLIHTIETRNVIDVAEAITLGALAREEFRGAHWRKEHQERKDEEWIKHTMLSWNDGNPKLYYKPVVLEGEDKTYEPKERSY